MSDFSTALEVTGVTLGATGVAFEVAGAASGLGLITGKLTAWIAPVGHSPTHFLQSLHLVKSMYATLFSTKGIAMLEKEIELYPESETFILPFLQRLKSQ